MTDRGLLYSEHILNKGLILLEALLKAHFQDASNKIKLIILKNLPLNFFSAFSVFRCSKELFPLFLRFLRDFII